MQETPKGKQKKIAIVMGCHRSGTSLIAAALKHFGAYLGKNLRSASEENEKGFFENVHIVDFNDRLLEFLNGRWDNPFFDGQQALSIIDEETLGPWQDEAEALFRDTFGDEDFCAIKDPRMCQLLPFWQRVLKKCDYHDEMIYYVHIARHPVEVAHSQRKRKQTNPVFYAMGDTTLETVALWFSLSIQALRDINSDNNCFFIYDDFLKYPRDQLGRFLDYLEIEKEQDRITTFVEEYIDKTLRHHEVASRDLQLLETYFPASIQLYKAQQALAGKKAFTRTDTYNFVDLWNKPEVNRDFNEAAYPFVSRVTHERHRSFLSTEILAKAEERLRRENDQMKERLTELDRQASHLSSKYLSLIHI